jgi:LEA14-like dessication related protein
MLTSCDTVVQPEFRKFEDVEVESLDTKQVELLANARYFNSNNIGGTLESCTFKVFVNEVFISDITHDISTDIEANKEFLLPIKANIPLNKIVNKDSGLFGQILNTLLQKKIYLKIEGDANLNFKGIPINVPFSRMDTVALKI